MRETSVSLDLRGKRHGREARRGLLTPTDFAVLTALIFLIRGVDLQYIFLQTRY